MLGEHTSETGDILDEIVGQLEKELRAGGAKNAEKADKTRRERALARCTRFDEP